MRSGASGWTGSSAWAWPLRRSTVPVRLLATVFWMTAITASVMAVLAPAREADRWQAPQLHVWASVLDNAVGVFSGALLLGEALHWQDWTAVVLMVAAIGLVLLKR